MLTVDADGTAALDQSGQISELGWTVDGDAITFTFEGEEFGGTLEDDAIVFEVGAFSATSPRVSSAPTAPEAGRVWDDPTVPEDVAQLAERLSRLEAERDVLATLYAYAHSIDYGDEEGWVDCFTDDGAFDIRSRVGHYGSRRVVGREELGQFIASHTRAPELWHKHMIVEPVIRVDGDTATSARTSSC